MCALLLETFAHGTHLASGERQRLCAQALPEHLPEVCPMSNKGQSLGGGRNGPVISPSPSAARRDRDGP